MDIENARQIAYERNLDLVLVDENNSVCKLMDYNKFKYEQDKKQKKQKPVQTKEIKLNLTIQENDLNTKAKQCNKFLKQNHKVKINIYFKGREITHKNKGYELLDKFLNKINEDYISSKPTLEKRNLICILERR